MVADQDVDNAFNGNTGPGTAALPYMLVARLYDGNLFGLQKDYAYPEGPNVTPSKYDDITTMSKLTTRTHTHIDGNTYDLFDGIQTIVKSILATNKTINDDEINSVNYKAPTA